MMGWAGLLLLAGCAGTGGQGTERAVSLLDDPGAWTAHPADGVQLELVPDDGALRLDFDFEGGGYAIARREVDLDLPANYAFRFRLRGEAPINHLEFKLVDAGDENVWWHVQRDVQWPEAWQTITIKKRHIGFAWGPQGGGEPGHVAALEFAVTAGSGGQGRIWIDGLELVPLPVRTGPPPAILARASTSTPGHDAAAAVDGDPTTGWRPAPGDTAAWLRLDLGLDREFGGLALSWADPSGNLSEDPDKEVEVSPGPAAYRVDFSDDGSTWRTRRRVCAGNGGQDHLFLPESEARFLRVVLEDAPAQPVGLQEIRLLPLDWSDRLETFVSHLAAEAPRGVYPRGFLDEPTLWTVVGVDGDRREGLLGQYGAVEAGPGEFSVEPFLHWRGRLLTWNDMQPSWRLPQGRLPLPEAVLDAGPWRLTVGAAGVGRPGASAQLVSYTLHNRGATPDSLTLYLAVRPFQVNPPVQFLNVRGGVAPVESLALRDGQLLVDGRPRALLLAAPDAFGAVPSDGGDVVADYLARGRLPRSPVARDPQGMASGALSYPLTVQPGDSARVDIILPLHEWSLADGQNGAAWSRQQAVDLREQALEHWRQRLDRVSISASPAAREALDTALAQLGWILVNRAGEGFQPGARSYARSWIRDGALTGVALLRLGQNQVVRDFLRWYAPHQYPSGKIPCVVDTRGADPVPEHDSTGQFIYLVAEYLRYSGDRRLAEEMWPRVLAGAGYLDSLLATRRTPPYQDPDLAEFRGILPPSISHEGYSAKPMHSYWDDFFALRGLKDAAWLADTLGHAEQAPRLRAMRDVFAADLGASLVAAMARHGIDYLPGCADLGDFDPTSTTVALDPAAAAALLPAGSLERTFQRYWEFFDARRGGEPWRAFTPYEVRTIGAFVRLGWRDRAQQLMEFFLDHRIPAGWRQWPEVVASDTTRAWFVGDMPHTWVGSDFVRSFLDMLVYEERGEDDTGSALVLAAGVPAAWLLDGGLGVARLPTPWGEVEYRLWQEDDGVVRLSLPAGSAQPPGGLRVDPPVSGLRATVDGLPATVDSRGRVLVSRLPAELRWAP